MLNAAALIKFTALRSNRYLAKTSDFVEIKYALLFSLRYKEILSAFVHIFRSERRSSKKLHVFATKHRYNL